MKTLRLIIGIISMVFFLIISFQSCAAGIGNALANSGESSGSAGIGLAILMLIAGIVGVAARKSKGGSITAGCFYILGSIIGYSNIGSFSDLAIWASVALIFGAVFIVTAVFQKKSASNADVKN